MATFNISWTPAGSSSDGQYIYYGKTNVVTGTPVSGTGWTLYTGNAIANTIGSAIINGLDDNVDYTFYGYAHCADAGNGPLTTVGPIIKNVCPVFVSVTPTFNGVSYNYTVPSSASNAGTWIEKIVVSLYDSANQNQLQTNSYSPPYSTNLVGSFSALSSSTVYNLQIAYSTNSGVRTSQCGINNFTTSAACVAPTVTVSNPTPSSFDVNWTPTTGGTFDILVNNSVIASGLTTGPYTVTSQSPATTYQVNVRKNCSTGGNAVSQTQSISTTTSLVNGVVSVNMNPSQGSSARKTLTMSFTFPTPTPAPLTINFGQTFIVAQNGGTHCIEYAGYDLFSVPQGTNPTCPFGTLNAGYAPSGNLPWVINIPAGVTSYTTPVDGIYTTAGPGPNVGSMNPGGFQYAPWSIAVGAANSVVAGIYIRVVSPSGYTSNFTITPGQNTSGGSGISIQNV